VPPERHADPLLSSSVAITTAAQQPAGFGLGVPAGMDAITPFMDLTGDDEGPPAVTLPERADEVERRLGMALKAYRQRAEEILESHFDGMEKTQMHYDHQVSMLKAENQKLRELLGKADEPDAAKACLFQAQQTAPKSKKDMKNKMKGGGDDDDRPKAVGKQRKKDAGPEQPGGTWQNFMAWVPNGAALQNPEPWKPLPPGTVAGMNATGDNTMKSQKSMVGGGGNAGLPGGAGAQFWGVMPGAIQNDRGKRDDKDDDSDSNASAEKQGQFEMFEVWKPTEKEMSKPIGDILANRAPRSASDIIAAVESEKGLYSKSFCDHQVSIPIYIINPDSNTRIAWDLVSLFMVIYDMIMIPMSVFSLPDHLFLQVMEWSTRLFWTGDVGMSCLTAVGLIDGSIEYDMKFILKRYLKTWFAMDMFIVGSDWFGYAFSSGGAGLSRLARVSRIARVIRLLRLARMQEVIANVTERIQSDKMMLVLRVSKLLIFLISCCHVTACGWWGVGNLPGGGGSWVKEYGYSSTDVSLQYLVSLHWSLAQFSGGLDSPAPTSGFERGYTVFVYILSFMSGLVMFSLLTSSLTQQYIIGGSGARQMATLKKYLIQNKVPKNLIKRIIRSAKHAISGDLQPDSVDLLVVVSEPLKIQMHYEMYSRVVSAHPFFSEFLTNGNQPMRRVCHSCMSMLLLDNTEVLFRQGDEPAEGKMYFVANGSLDYLSKHGETISIGEKQWAAEPALWTVWKHQGTLTAVTDAKICVLDAEEFQLVCGGFIKKSKGLTFNPKQYCAKFVAKLNKTSEWNDLTRLED